MNQKAASKRTVAGVKSIWITEYDRERIGNLIEDIKENKAARGLQELEAKLDRARIVKPQEIPENVVTMNCLVKLHDLDTDEETEYWLRFSRRCSESRVVAILSDLGIALLGGREGDTIEWSHPQGRRRAEIVEVVYQPERLGNYEL